MVEKESICYECGTLSRITNERFKEYEKKTKKYDDLMNANSQVVKDNISLTQLQQENKQLKEAKEFSVKEGLKLIDENFQLGVELADYRQKLEKMEKPLEYHVATPEELDRAFKI